MPIIYRIEHEHTREGAFVSEHAPIGYDRPINVEHPSIITDTEESRNGHDFQHSYVCGCTSLEGLRWWFDDREWLHELHTCGFVIGMYDVPPELILYGKSGTQVAFYRSDEYHVRDHVAFKLSTRLT